MERAVEELIDLIRTHPRENPEVALEDGECALFRSHYARQMYQVQRSAMANTSFLQCFFAVPHHRMRMKLSQHPCSNSNLKFGALQVEYCVLRTTAAAVIGTVNLTAVR